MSFTWCVIFGVVQESLLKHQADGTYIGVLGSWAKARWSDAHCMWVVNTPETDTKDGECVDVWGEADQYYAESRGC